ncbi:N-acetylmuramoyl-L-alanine amidase [Christensenellaceae bacterium OttesenSCG-928-L17]|nr:N-acetylmuramoyl-L-alanine amidase [Christensenellaceae bacterium OttesenSCG-928-L17]
MSPLQNTTLREGAQGENVKELQSNLSELGLYEYEVDGNYGSHTAKAVRSLQNILDVEASGSLNKQTIAAYNTRLSSGELRVPVARTLAGMRIGIDPGHQKNADNKTEVVLPGTNRTKERMSPGAVGVKSKTQEYEIVLLVANYLKTYLEDAGAAVVMTRSTNDVSISNRERARAMNDANVDLWVRLHCDYSNDKETAGAYTLCPNKTVKPAIADESLALSRAVLVEFCKETGATMNSILLREDQTGFNWSNMPVTAIEMGYLSNAEEDLRLNKTSYQQSCARGICNGIISYVNAVRAAAEEE